MIDLAERMAQAALRLSAKISPSQRADWFAAMASEYDYVPKRQQFRFAAGCLMSALRERAVSPAFVTAAARALLVVAAAIWALVNIRFAGLPVAAGVPSLQAFAYCAATVFAAGGLATAIKGFKATLALAGPLLLLGGAGTLILTFTLPPGAANRLVLALLAEHLTMLLAAISVVWAAKAIVHARPGAMR